MKKTIKVLGEKMDKLQEKENGTFRGGFAAIKGGYKAFDDSTNSNTSGCSNTVDCSHSTNTVTCTNSGICFV